MLEKLELQALNIISTFLLDKEFTFVETQEKAKVSAELKENEAGVYSLLISVNSPSRDLSGEFKFTDSGSMINSPEEVSGSNAEEEVQNAT
jgi:hypothetical protein